MEMLSRFASRFTQSSGIGVLMEDLGKAMAEGGDGASPLARLRRNQRDGTTIGGFS